MTLIRRDFFAKPSLQSVTWDAQQGCFVTSQRVNGTFEPTPVDENFILDWYQAEHGYEWWLEKDGKRERQRLMCSVAEPLPEPPDSKAVPLYTVPIRSRELGGARELVIKGEAVTAAYADLFDQIEQTMAGVDELAVPEIRVDAIEGEYGPAPKFEIADWSNRPMHWGKPKVRI